MSNGFPLPDDLISAYRDGELSAAERKAAARLLEDSADARTELEDYQALSDLLRGMPAEKAPSGLRAAVMQRIERESLLAPVAARPQRKTRRFWVVGTLLAASAAGLLVAFNVGRRDSPSVGERLAVNEHATDASRDLLERAPSPSGRSVPPAASFARDADEFGASTRLAADDRRPAGEWDARSTAGRPPIGAQPGDAYSYADVGTDGQLVVVEATVVDVARGLNELRYFFQKNSIQSQPVSTASEEELRSVSNPAGNDFGVYVVSDPVQIDAAIQDARRRPDVFFDFKVAGVLNPDSESLSDDSESDATPPEPDVAASGTLARRGMPPSDGADRPAPAPATQLEDQVRPQARASYPADRFTTDAAPLSGRVGVSPAVGAPRDEAARSEASPAPAPSADAAAPEFAESSEASPTYGYQQTLNVSKAEIEGRIEREQERLKRAYGVETPAMPGMSGAVAGGTRKFFSEPPPEQNETLGEREAESPEPRQQAAQQLQRRMRMLVLLQADPKLSKAKAVPARDPVEAPQPSRKKG